MKRVGGWIVGDGWCFHAGSDQTGYPTVTRCCDVHGHGVGLALPSGVEAPLLRTDNAEDAAATANKIIALILEAHQHSSAKKPDGGAA